MDPSKLTELLARSGNNECAECGFRGQRGEPFQTHVENFFHYLPGHPSLFQMWSRSSLGLMEPWSHYLCEVCWDSPGPWGPYFQGEEPDIGCLDRGAISGKLLNLFYSLDFGILRIFFSVECGVNRACQIWGIRGRRRCI